MQKKTPLSFMKKRSLEDNWKDLDEEVLGGLAGSLTDVVDYLTPERKERSRKPSAQEEEDEYFEELRKKRKARYEALKEKYKD